MKRATSKSDRPVSILAADIKECAAEVESEARAAPGSADADGHAKPSTTDVAEQVATQVGAGAMAGAKSDPARAASKTRRGATTSTRRGVSLKQETAVMIGGASASLIPVAGQISNSHHKATPARAGARSPAETSSSPSAHRTRSAVSGDTTQTRSSMHRATKIVATIGPASSLSLIHI